MSLGSQPLAPVQVTKAHEPDKYPFDLGKHKRAITTSHPATQIWFDRGLIWMYGFCHEEAGRCFQRAHDLDPDCAMALWGLACAAGPHYNFGWESYGPAMQKQIAQKTYDYSTRAKAACGASKEGTRDPTTSLEDALIDAIQVRYPQASAAETSKAYASWDAAYADRMQAIYDGASDDLDVVALYAEAMLNLAPWKMWDLKTGKPTGAPARTLTAKAVLERALQSPEGRCHPGILHMYIHLMEMSPQPEAAVEASNALRGNVPDSGHLQHMASHIDVLVGTYSDGVKSNVAAVDADRKFMAMEGVAGMYTVYAMHNVTSLVFAAMMAGNYGNSLSGCGRLEEITTDAFLRIEDPPWADYAEAAWGTRYHVLVRFGRWREILDVQLPHDTRLYCVTIATARYARSLAHAALGNIAAAESERQSFIAAAEQVPKSRLHFPNNSREVLALARSMLDGELEYRKGNYGDAFAHLADAVRRDDELLYAEPPSWTIPARHAAAALLFEQGRTVEAAEYYAQDLGIDFAEKSPDRTTLARARQHPLNPWALRGYYNCLMKLGKIEAAQDIMEKLKFAAVGADINIAASCFCALETIEIGRRKGASGSNRRISSSL